MRQMRDDKLLEIVQTANIAAEMLLRSQPEVDVVTVFRDVSELHLSFLAPIIISG